MSAAKEGRRKVMPLRFFRPFARRAPCAPPRPARFPRPTHGLDQLVLACGELRRPALAPGGVVLDLGRQLRAEREVLDLHLAAGALVAALDDDARRAAAVGIFHLRLHAGAAEIHFRPDAGLPEGGHHLLVAAERVRVLVHDEDHDRRDDLGVLQLAEILQRRGQPRHADGEARRRHRLAAEARDEPVIAPAARHRAEAHDLALLVRHLEQKLRLVDRAGIVFEPAHHGGVDPDAPVVVAGCL